MDRGWIKLYRKILENEFLTWDNTAYLLFTKLLMYADRKDGTYTTGQRALAERANLPYGTTYSALKRLIDEGLISVENRQKYSKIHITNWSVYQSNREIDNLLEEHVPLIKRRNSGKLENSKKLQAATQAPNNSSDNEDHQAPDQAQLKHNSSTRQDYNKKEELRIKNKTISSVSSKTDLSKLFYELVKILGFTESIKYTEQRYKKLKARLKTYSADELKDAATIVAGNSFLQGDNPSGVRYGTVDYLLRSDENLDNKLNSAAQSAAGMKPSDVAALIAREKQSYAR